MTILHVLGRCLRWEPDITDRRAGPLNNDGLTFSEQAGMKGERDVSHLMSTDSSCCSSFGKEYSVTNLSLWNVRP